ncbi:hypothetical protein GGX14DRAFT_696631 [Mycena pura]|uniref:DUF6533 domain-containing protein n=1 Tax=Mycena pura TaxID=153505 RepID=A0AAD6VJ11_9AGAR|nr:hypothetical protein GGX14DRAFT_696631 [Mycena pura]
MNTAEVQTQLNIYYYIEATQFTLLFYDYFLTLEWEVSRYWRRGSASPAVLFFANRYGTLLGNIPIVFRDFWTTPASPSKGRMYCPLSDPCSTGPIANHWLSCNALDMYHQFFIVIIQIIIGVMLILRTYALYERNNRVLGFMLAFAAGVICIGVWATIDSDHAPAADMGPVPLNIGCTYTVSSAEGKGLIIAWSAMGLFDCMIFLLTLHKTLRRRRSTGLNFLAVFMRDGCIYFGLIQRSLESSHDADTALTVSIMVISNLCNILSFALGTPYTRGLFNTTTNMYARRSISDSPGAANVNGNGRISSLMITRLMLNIRDPALATRARSGSRETSARGLGGGVFSTYLASVPSQQITSDEWI